MQGSVTGIPKFPLLTFRRMIPGLRENQILLTFHLLRVSIFLSTGNTHRLLVISA
jgi:hypothetical protein